MSLLLLRNHALALVTQLKQGMNVQVTNLYPIENRVKSSFKGWTTWSSWSECNNKGMKDRNRTCFNPTNDATVCPGESSEIDFCGGTPYNIHRKCAYHVLLML